MATKAVKPRVMIAALLIHFTVPLVVGSSLFAFYTGMVRVGFPQTLFGFVLAPIYVGAGVSRYWFPALVTACVLSAITPYLLAHTSRGLYVLICIVAGASIATGWVSLQDVTERGSVLRTLHLESRESLNQLIAVLASVGFFVSGFVVSIALSNKIRAAPAPDGRDPCV